MIRTLHPELLDDLPADEPAAIGSRRDLRRLNTLMGHAAIIARCLKNIFPHKPPSRIVEIGAGDGHLLLRIARQMHSSCWIHSQRSHHREGAAQFPPLPEGLEPLGKRRKESGRSQRPARTERAGASESLGRGEGESTSTTTTVSHPPLPSTSATPLVDVLFIDLQNLLSTDTKIEFAVLNWRVRSVQSDVFDWLSDSSAKTDVVLANLFLHHFTDAQLTRLFSEIAEKADALIAVEPRRARWPLFCARLLALIGCNVVTCHDAPISVRAGFTDRELSALWPRNDDWELTERRAGLFSHLFVARRKGR